MSSKVKNTIIFLIIGAALVLIYIFFIKKPPQEASLVSYPPTSVDTSGMMPGVMQGNVSLGQETSNNPDLVSILLNVKNIKLDDSIFRNPAFTSLIDSSITLSQDGTQGRPNPFAPIGSDQVQAVGAIAPASGGNATPVPASVPVSTSAPTLKPKQ